MKITISVNVSSWLSLVNPDIGKGYSARAVAQVDSFFNVNVFYNSDSARVLDTSGILSLGVGET